MHSAHRILISGKSATGKSLSLRNLTNPEGVMYLNCEHKNLPFPSKFKQFNITDPLQVYEALEKAEERPKVEVVVIDSLTFLMDMFESVYVTNATNGLKAWGEYANYFKVLMNQYVAKSTKTVIFTAHTLDVLNDIEGAMETLVKVKGSLMNTGIEAYFETVISSKKMPIKRLKDYTNSMLNITEEERLLGYKYLFQTKLTRDTVHERIRAPMGLWTTNESFIDNDLELVLNHLDSYYAN